MTERDPLALEADAQTSPPSTPAALEQAALEDVTARLHERAYEFEFFQAVRLMAAARGGPHTVGGPSPSTEAVRIIPDPASVFPASDVRRVRPRGRDEPAEMHVGFGGLFGVDAALPTTFHERVSPGTESESPLRDFLDFLGHRPYAQLWRAWARYRPEVRGGVGRRDVHAVRAAALSGITETDAVAAETAELLPLAARLSAWTRNAEGLRALIQHATGLRVRVIENVPRRVRLGDRPALGTARVGIDAVVGATIYDESGMFRLQIGPLGLGAFRDLLPGQAGARRVASLVRLYTSDTLDYDVELHLIAEEAPPLKLGDGDSARLGRNAHLGKPRTPLVQRRVRYAAA
ncbi:type VI secretion system baseplate subunit TssG [Rubrivirga sp.]|uniref:type VI secretion system baseplate subunit TssG n=1 Tax=Rubrivirga sp. TaxID=1885344 RepID=UPI003C782725